VAWKPPWTGTFSGCKLLDGLQRHLVTHPVKPRTRRRSAICRGRLDSNLHVLPAAAARISPALAPPGGGRSPLPLPRASQRRPLAPPTTAAASSAYGPSPVPCTPPPHPPRHRRIRCLPIIQAVAGEPGSTYTGSSRFDFHALDCDLHL
jgi:hypothetical protein